MVHNLMLIVFLLVIPMVSCKKNDDSINVTTTGCFPDAVTSRQIVNAKATIKKLGEQFFIIEQNTIDTRLNPCNLSPEFQVDNLAVTIDGEVKVTTNSGNQPCCTDNFVITKISK